jgi:hypothetical protein
MKNRSDSRKPSLQSNRGTGGRVDRKCDYDWALSGHPIFEFAPMSRKCRVDLNSWIPRAAGHRNFGGRRARFA